MTLRIETTKFRNDSGAFFPWLDKEEKAKFELAVNKALDRIRSTQVGSSLIVDIENAGQEVAIIRAADNVDNKCAQQDQSASATLRTSR
jgi:hypothetical protein